MIVIGNDIVSLQNDENRRTFKRKGIERFFQLDSIVNLTEKKRLSEIASLWAAKEAAYKCLLKYGLQVSFSPAKFKVHYHISSSKLLGIVTYDNFSFYVQCIEDGEYVRAIACNNENTLHKIKSLHLKNTSSIYKSIEKRIERLIPNEKVSFYKNDNNIPNITNINKNKRLEISLSKEEHLYYVSILPEWQPYCTNIKSLENLRHNNQQFQVN